MDAGFDLFFASARLMSFDPLRRATCLARRKLPRGNTVPRYRLDVVDFPASTFGEPLTLPQPFAMSVIMIGIATLRSETTGENANRKRTAECAIGRVHVVLA